MLSGPQLSVLRWMNSLYGRYCCSDISCVPLMTSCTTNTKRKIAVAWKNSCKLIRWPNRDHNQATPAAARPDRPDLRRYDKLIATIRNASNPSRSVMTRAWSMIPSILDNETESQNENPVYRGISDQSSRR